MGGEARRMGGRGRRRAALVAALLLAVRAGAQAGLPAAPPAGTGWVALAPYLAQLVRLAAVDPALAASLVPDGWIDAALDGAFRVAAETPVAAAPDPPHAWPIGPWASPAALVATLDAVDPAAVAALYRAATPRLTARCRARQASLDTCEQALRRTGARLSAGAVLERAAGTGSPEVTPTQRELARLGVPVAASLGQRIRGVATRLWGAGWPQPASDGSARGGQSSSGM